MIGWVGAELAMGNNRTANSAATVRVAKKDFVQLLRARCALPPPGAGRPWLLN